MLDIIGNLQPGPRDGPDTVDGHEDPDDRASVGSSSRADTNASYLRPIDLVQALRNLSSISHPSGGPLRLKRLSIAHSGNHSTRNTQCASHSKGSPPPQKHRIALPILFV